MKQKGFKKLIIENLSLARRLWPHQIGRPQAVGLKLLTTRHHFSLAVGDLQQIDGRWYVTHSGLLGLAQRSRCAGIQVTLVTNYCDRSLGRWVFKATVYKARGPLGFVGYGDADPSNVSPLVRGAEMRVAETRAVNRALRKAYGIGLCSVEELGWPSSTLGPANDREGRTKQSAELGSGNGRPRLRDRLCALIRHHKLDPLLVKAYAAEFCGTETLKDARRDLIESFVSHLAASANEDLEGLICKLNSFSQLPEAKP